MARVHDASLTTQLLGLEHYRHDSRLILGMYEAARRIFELYGRPSESGVDGIA